MGEDVDNDTIEASTIRIYPDLTSKHTYLIGKWLQLLNYYFLKYRSANLVFNGKNVQRGVSSVCPRNIEFVWPKSGISRNTYCGNVKQTFELKTKLFNSTNGLQLGSPVYEDSHKQGYLEYMAPGVVVSICYIMATGLTSLAFIIERRGLSL